MKTNLANRIAHTSLPKSRGLLPLFEAVVNAIHAIDEAGISMEQGRIDIKITRENENQRTLVKKRGRETLADITAFSVSDNGVGFNDANMKSFETLDSDYKADLGCFGVGRLMWLKAFEIVRINSNYIDRNEKLKNRNFHFTARRGIKENEPKDLNEQNDHSGSVVILEGYKPKYRDASKKTLESIARGLLEHCLWYFLRPSGAPRIVLHDSTETIDMYNILDESMHAQAKLEVFEVNRETFELTHIRLTTTSARTHSLNFCAASRLVREENIAGKISGLHTHLTDENGQFVYAGYITSDYLTQHARTERFEFDIPEKHDGLFQDTEISMQDIRKAALERVSDYLEEYVEKGRIASQERIDSYVNKTAPGYKPILKRIQRNGLSIDPTISDKELELTLHKERYKIEREVLTEGHDILSAGPDDDSWPEYQERLNSYLIKVSDIKKSDLADYVSHRRVIIDLLEKALKINEEGKYSREDIVHNLIFPMQTDSSEVDNEEFNLWLVDERLAFHEYLASDKYIKSMPITDSEENKRPDILSLSVYDTPILTSDSETPPLASLTVVELKKPMRNDVREGEDKDPIEQSLGYLERIRDGKVKTKNGRMIPNSPDIPGYCYVLCDLTPTMVKRCKLHNLKVTSDKMGYFGYNENYKAYIEVISFDRLVNAAKERNKAFFKKLGLPSK